MIQQKDYFFIHKRLAIPLLENAFILSYNIMLVRLQFSQASFGNLQLFIKKGRIFKQVSEYFRKFQKSSR